MYYYHGQQEQDYIQDVLAKYSGHLTVISVLAKPRGHYCRNNVVFAKSPFGASDAIVLTDTREEAQRIAFVLDLHHDKTGQCLSN